MSSAEFPAVDDAGALGAWAAGDHPSRAGVGLLLAAVGGRFARRGWPWVRVDDAGSIFIDFAQITDQTLAGLSGGEQRLLRIVADVGAGPLSQVGYLPPAVVDLVLAAVADAAGLHHEDPAADDRPGRP